MRVGFLVRTGAALGGLRAAKHHRRYVYVATVNTGESAQRRFAVDETTMTNSRRVKEHAKHVRKGSELVGLSHTLNDPTDMPSFYRMVFSNTSSEESKHSHTGLV